MADDDDLSASNLEDFLQGDDFMSEEQREEKAASERRLARKRRLQSLQPKEEEIFTTKPKIKPKEKTKGDDQISKMIVEKTSDTADAEPEKRKNLHYNDDTEAKVSEDDDDDDFDIFSSSVSPVEKDKSARSKTSTATAKDDINANVDTQQDFDDAEGYYKATIGETIHLDLGENSTATSAATTTTNDTSNDSAHVQFRVSGVIGKGVFSTVLKAATESISPNITTEIQLPPQVAIKCIRHNETMAKAAVNEIRFLQRFNHDSKNKKQQKGGKNNDKHSSSSSSTVPHDGIVHLLLPTETMVPPILEHRGHTLLVFPYMPFNLRDVLAKFGKGVGLSLTAVRSYFGQLLAAATHLKQHNIIHCDLKPDNILVSQDFSTVRLCDFGSAVDANEQSFESITPYLVSRFYRAPEIILGLEPTFAIDLWSLAVTVAELFLGKVLFQGINNNDMLRVMMQHMGPFSNRVIRQHLVQTKKYPLPAHFTQEVSSKRSIHCSCFSGGPFCSPFVS